MAKVTISVSPMFERTAVLYIKKVAQQEMIGLLRKGIRKMSQQIAEDMVNNLDLTIYLKDEIDKKSLAMAVRKKDR